MLIPLELRRLLPASGGALAHAAGFSVFVNLMLLAPTLFMLQVFDRVLTSRSVPTLVMLLMGVAIALLAMAVVDVARSRLLVDLGRSVEEALAQPMFRQLVRGASQPLDPLRPSLRDLATLRTFLSGPNIIALFDAPWALVYLVLIALFHPLLGGLALLGAVALMLLAWLAELGGRATQRELGEAQRQAAVSVQQGLRHADVLNAMGMAGPYAHHWAARNREGLALMQAGGARVGGLHATSKLLRQAVQVLMMAAGAWLVLDSHVSAGVMMAATILFGRALAPVEALIGNWAGLMAARQALGRLAAIAPQLQPAPARTPLPAPRGDLTLEAVSLAGASPDRPILRQVSLALPAGRSLGVLGPSGAGKSSLSRAIVGARACTSGRVCLDGAALTQWDPDELGRHVGYLPQEVGLFDGTVAENIARFQACAGGEVAEAARRAHAFDMILKLPQGFDTVIGEAGLRLSAGQAQRIGLARAVFGKPCLVVLDEPNAHVDAEGEAALMATLATLRQEGTTVVMVTHKVGLVTGLDELLVLREGRAELVGPRETVLARLSGHAALVPLRKGGG